MSINTMEYDAIKKNNCQLHTYYHAEMSKYI